MVIIPPKGSSARVGSVLNPLLEKSPRRRVYYYGDELHNVNVRKLVEGSGRELIRRSPDRSRDLLGTNKRIQELESRPLVGNELTIVNGLPQDSQAVTSMGGMVVTLLSGLIFAIKFKTFWTVTKLKLSQAKRSSSLN